MKRYILLISIALMAASCGKKATVKVEVKSAAGKEVLFSKLNFNKIDVVDTLKLDKSGKASVKFALPEEAPDFYYLSYGRKRLASLVVKPGDKISVVADTLTGSAKIEGSPESQRLAMIDSTFYAAIAKFDVWQQELVQAMERGDKEREEQIKTDVSNLYVQYKRGALKTLLTQPASFANISLLYQQFNSMLAVFADPNDVYLFRTIRDTLKTLYPTSSYVKALTEVIERHDANEALREKIEKAQQTLYPELSLPDVNSQTRRLSELEGKPFILLFWMPSEVSQKVINLHLKEIYNLYHSKGLEIYSVAVGDKSLWATTIKEQGANWINVNDGKGASSPALGIYNVTTLPAMFISNKEGKVVARDLFDTEKLKSKISAIL